MQIVKVHLISDSTGETVSSVSRAAFAQFENIDAEEYMWPLVRTKGQMEKVLAKIEENKGVVMYTLAETKLIEILIRFCEEINIPCIPILSRTLEDLSKYLGMKVNPQPGKQHEMDEDYFKRVEAINYTLGHDDGQSSRDLEQADIILVGVSRTSKSPTCVYLAHRGYKAANIPYVVTCPLPDQLFTVKNPLIVGLTISAERLISIRKNRLISMNEDKETQYIDVEYVTDELRKARLLFSKNNWPVIDVTKRSVEETAAAIIQLYNNKISKPLT